MTEKLQSWVEYIPQSFMNSAELFDPLNVSYNTQSSETNPNQLTNIKTLVACDSWCMGHIENMQLVQSLMKNTLNYFSSCANFSAMIWHWWFKLTKVFQNLSCWGLNHWISGELWEGHMYLFKFVVCNANVVRQSSEIFLK